MGDLGVVFEGVGLEQTVHEHRVGAGLVDQPLQFGQAMAATQDQACIPGLQCVVEGRERFVQPPARRAADRPPGVVVQDEDRHDRPPRLGRVVQGGIVLQTQIAAEPEDDGLDGQAGELRDNLRSSSTSAT